MAATGKRSTADSMESSQPGAPDSRVALFGGSFNPPHRTHHRITRAALEQLPIGQLWVLPCGNHPLKDNRDLAPAMDRLHLCRLAFADLDQVWVSDLDLRGERPAYTVELLERVGEEFPAVGRPYWLLGADNLPQLTLWKDYRRLFDLADVVVYPRRGYELDATVVDRLDIDEQHRQQLLACPLQFAPDAISSTAIRAALAPQSAGDALGDDADHAEPADLEQWLAPAVLESIRDRGLYRVDR